MRLSIIYCVWLCKGHNRKYFGIRCTLLLDASPVRVLKYSIRPPEREICLLLIQYIIPVKLPFFLYFVLKFITPSPTLSRSLIMCSHKHNESVSSVSNWLNQIESAMRPQEQQPQTQKKDKSDLWPLTLEVALIEGLLQYHKNNKKVYHENKKNRHNGRSIVVSDFIYEKTGQRRTRAQVSSKLQVLKRNRQRYHEILHLIERGSLLKPEDPAVLVEEAHTRRRTVRNRTKDLMHKNDHPLINNNTYNDIIPTGFNLSFDYYNKIVHPTSFSNFKESPINVISDISYFNNKTYQFKKLLQQTLSSASLSGKDSTIFHCISNLYIHDLIILTEGNFKSNFLIANLPNDFINNENENDINVHTRIFQSNHVICDSNEIIKPLISNSNLHSNSNSLEIPFVKKFWSGFLSFLANGTTLFEKTNQLQDLYLISKITNKNNHSEYVFIWEFQLSQCINDASTTFTKLSKSLYTTNLGNNPSNFNLYNQQQYQPPQLQPSYYFGNNNTMEPTIGRWRANSNLASIDPTKPFSLPNLNMTSFNNNIITNPVTNSFDLYSNSALTSSQTMNLPLTSTISTAPVTNLNTYDLNDVFSLNYNPSPLPLTTSLSTSLSTTTNSNPLTLSGYDMCESSLSTSTSSDYVDLESLYGSTKDSSSSSITGPLTPTTTCSIPSNNNIHSSNNNFDDTDPQLYSKGLLLENNSNINGLNCNSKRINGDVEYNTDSISIKKEKFI